MQDNLLHRDQALACGMTKSAVDRRTSSGEWPAVLPRVYSVDAADITWTRKVRAAALWAGAGSVLSHQTAASLWRMEGFPPGPIVLATTRRLRGLRDISIRRVGSLNPADIGQLYGMQVTTPFRTLFDLAAIEPSPKVGEALDAALRSGLVSLARLRWFVETHGGRGRPGTTTMRTLLAERPSGYAPPESPLERRVCNLIVRSGLPRPTLQHKVLAEGRLVARVDIACPDVLVAIEVDGYRWHSGRNAWARDLARRNRLTALGWQILHVTHEDVEKRPLEVIDQVRQVLADATLTLQLR